MVGNTIKLQVELVPSSSWYDNLRKKMPKEKWDALRKQVYLDYSYRCDICEAKGKLNCHELWEYDDKKHTQKLVGFIALCDMCHHVKHLGLASVLASRGELDYEKVIEHFMKVNNCSLETFYEQRDKAFAVWQERSKHQWRLDLGLYENAIEKLSKKDTNKNRMPSDPRQSTLNSFE